MSPLFLLVHTLHHLYGTYRHTVVLSRQGDIIGKVETDLKLEVGAVQKPLHEQTLADVVVEEIVLEPHQLEHWKKGSRYFVALEIVSPTGEAYSESQLSGLCRQF